MFFAGRLTITIRNFEFLRSELFLDASILAAMTVNWDSFYQYERHLMLGLGKLTGSYQTHYEYELYPLLELGKPDR